MSRVAAFAGREHEEGRKFGRRDLARALAALVRYRFAPLSRRS